MSATKEKSASGGPEERQKRPPRTPSFAEVWGRLSRRNADILPFPVERRQHDSVDPLPSRCVDPLLGGAPDFIWWGVTTYRRSRSGIEYRSGVAIFATREEPVRAVKRRLYRDGLRINPHWRAFRSIPDRYYLHVERPQ